MGRTVGVNCSPAACVAQRIGRPNTDLTLKVAVSRPVWAAACKVRVCTPLSQHIARKVVFIQSVHHDHPRTGARIVDTMLIASSDQRRVDFRTVSLSRTSLKSCSRLRRHFLNVRAHHRDAGWEPIRLRLIEGLARVDFGIEHDD